MAEIDNTPMFRWHPEILLHDPEYDWYIARRDGSEPYRYVPFHRIDLSYNSPLALLFSGTKLVRKTDNDTNLAIVGAREAAQVPVVTTREIRHMQLMERELTASRLRRQQMIATWDDMARSLPLAGMWPVLPSRHPLWCAPWAQKLYEAVQPWGHLVLWVSGISAIRQIVLAWPSTTPRPWTRDTEGRPL